ncbi:hypothetical protein VFPFJ_10154 [Purpureocillium lilacinum]|uniref:Uncharacterized protein n=1 Tax=Purpureocillium lilacinum TaxID=33203 RepID=A0A179GJY7_PURLI|nr:hypothetical protein VFPFJ_10154 [Purpureocillium lilacinum]OAQ78122.1 hypothetical protein VFPFJ_10154 [Purpureocillium lilacinum]
MTARQPQRGSLPMRNPAAAPTGTLSNRPATSNQSMPAECGSLRRRPADRQPGVHPAIPQRPRT